MVVWQVYCKRDERAREAEHEAERETEKERERGKKKAERACGIPKEGHDDNNDLDSFEDLDLDAILSGAGRAEGLSVESLLHSLQKSKLGGGAERGGGGGL